MSPIRIILPYRGILCSISSNGKCQLLPCSPGKYIDQTYICLLLLLNYIILQSYPISYDHSDQGYFLWTYITALPLLHIIQYLLIDGSGLAFPVVSLRISCSTTMSYSCSPLSVRATSSLFEAIFQVNIHSHIIWFQVQSWQLQF